MTYKTLLVHMTLGGDNAGVLGIAGQLAERFGAKVIGIAAAQPIQPMYNEGCSVVDLVSEDRAEKDQELADCAVQFRSALQGIVSRLEWRSVITIDLLANYVAEQASCADLIITAKDPGAEFMDNSRHLALGDLVLKAGRPVLVVPPGITALPLQHVHIAWKDTREARRAAADALPLLEAAGQAVVLQVAAESGQAEAQAQVKDVAGWLEQHGVKAQPCVVVTGRSEVGALHAALVERKCDLLVAGAYGHNRLGEWMFGGVTQDVLLDPGFCVLLAH